MSARRKKANTTQHEADAEFQILLDATSRIDFVEWAERVRRKTKTRLIELALEHAAAQGCKIERANAERRVEALIVEDERRSLALVKIINDEGIERAESILRRLQRCEIWFSTVTDGWKATRRAFGRWDTDSSVKMIRRECPDEVAQYKAARRSWREARRRYLATETEASWQWYRAGKGNRNSVAYRSRVDLARRGGEEHFRNRRLLRYMIYELLPRPVERRRARREMGKAETAIRQARERILERMRVPLDLY